MSKVNISNEAPHYSGLYGAVKKSINKYGILRWLISLPLIFIYSVSYALFYQEYKTTYDITLEELTKRIAVEKSEIATPVTLPRDLFYYSTVWQDMAGENPLVSSVMTSTLEYLFKTINFLKDIQGNDEAMIKKMVIDKMNGMEGEKTDKRTAEEIYQSISSKGEYFSRLIDQLFTMHGLKKLETKYTDTDVEIFFNMLFKSPAESQFRRLLGAFVLNAPYYLVIKNSINEYYQNNDILIPVDLFSFTLFMMFLDQVKNKDIRPTIEDCRNWVFEVIVTDEKKKSELQSSKISIQQIIREEMIMPNPGYFSKAYNGKKHKAIDIASGRGTMIRSPLTGTVKYYERSSKKSRTGNFIIIKDDKSDFNIFICHMDDKDYIEEHSTEGELAEPIANLEPDWVHPVKKGQFFEVVGSSGRSTGAHTHIQIARRISPYPTFDFFLVNKQYQKQFNSYLVKNGYWPAYSRNEDLLLSVLGMVISRYDSTRHFADRDPAILELYSKMQRSYTPVSETVDSLDISLEKIPENILRTYFSKKIQEKIITERYVDQLRYYTRLILHYNHFLKLEIPLASTPPEKAIPLTPWQITRRRKKNAEDSTAENNIHEHLFFQAINKFFLYKILQLNETPRDIRDKLLSDPMFTLYEGDDLSESYPEYPLRNIDNWISLLENYISGIVNKSVDLTFINGDDFCESVFEIITDACRAQGIPLDSNFGFYRYHMDELSHSYQTSRFINFPDTREFKYNKKYDSAIRLFFLDIFELAAEHGNFTFFRELYCNPEELSMSIFHKSSQKFRKLFARFNAKIRYKLFNTTLPVELKISPYNMKISFQKLIENIAEPLSFESRSYAEKTLYRAAETSLFYSLIYEVFLNEREHYMILFPEEQLTGVIDAIGLFDSMFKVFCDNTARKQVIDKENIKITRELELVEKELEISKQARRELQEDFKKESANFKQLGDYVSRQGELYSNYFSEEEKISKRIALLEQSIDQYRNECNEIKRKKAEMEKQYEEKLEIINSEIEDLKSKSTLEQDRFSIEMRNISYHKEKADRKIIDLKTENNLLKKEIDVLNAQLNEAFKKSDKGLEEERSSSEKAALIRNLKDSKYEIMIRDLDNERNRLLERDNEFIKIVSSSMGLNAEDITLEKLANEILVKLQAASRYGSTIKMLQEQQKNDKRSLVLNTNLINEMKDKLEKVEVQLQYLRDTTASFREKDLEDENERLTARVKELQSALSERSGK